MEEDAEIVRDTTAAVGLLGELYRALELGRAPTSTPPEVVAATEAVADVSRPNGARPKGGQGFGLTAAERSVVELHAMGLAQAWLTTNDYINVRDVHRTHSCDFLASKNGVETHIEVKGTTSAFGSILLTANEVQLHQAQHPNNVLLVVHDIDLLPLRTKVSGEEVRAFGAWDIGATNLRPLSYQCFLTDPAKLASAKA